MMNCVTNSKILAKIFVFLQSTQYLHSEIHFIQFIRSDLEKWQLVPLVSGYVFGVYYPVIHPN